MVCTDETLARDDDVNDTELVTDAVVIVVVEVVVVVVVVAVQPTLVVGQKER